MVLATATQTQWEATLSPQQIQAMSDLLTVSWLHSHSACFPLHTQQDIVEQRYAAAALHWLRHPEVHTLLATEAETGRLQGLVVLHEGNPEHLEELPMAVLSQWRQPCYLKFCYVHPDFHGKGVAGTLMREALHYAQQRGASHVYLGTHPQNPQAVRFYEKQGFTCVGSSAFAVESEELHPQLILAKELADAVSRH